MMAPIGPVLGLLTAAVVTYVTPVLYESRARIEVRPWHVAGKAAEPPSMKTERETITSHRLLAKVIEHLDLANQWGMDRDAALVVLDGMVTAGEIKGTDLIDVRVRCTDKEAARDIAVEVVRIYKEDRDEVKASEADRVLEGLRKAVRTQEEKVEARRQELADLIRSQEVGVGEGKARDGAKEKLEAEQAAEQKCLEEIKLKAISELPRGDEDVVLPFESVIVHDDPVLPQSPVSPNVAFNLTVGTVLGLLFGLPLALLVAWLLEQLVPRQAVQ